MGSANGPSRKVTDDAMNKGKAKNKATPAPKSKGKVKPNGSANGPSR